MVYLQQMSCWKCHKSFQSANGRERFCYECRSEKEKEEKDKWLFDLRDGKTCVERIEQIEEWMYEYQKHKHSSIHDIIG